MSEPILPEVAGRRLLVRHAQFERSCQVLLYEEERKLLPNNALVDVLCNSVRLSREHCDAMTQGGWNHPDFGKGATEP
jgi:hypothetical protein